MSCGQLFNGVRVAMYDEWVVTFIEPEKSVSFSEIILEVIA